MEAAKGEGVMRPAKGDQVRAKSAVSKFLPFAPCDVGSPLQGSRADPAALDRDAASNTLGWCWARFAGGLAA